MDLLLTFHPEFSSESWSRIGKDGMDLLLAASYTLSPSTPETKHGRRPMSLAIEDVSEGIMIMIGWGWVCSGSYACAMMGVASKEQLRLVHGLRPYLLALQNCLFGARTNMSLILKK